MNPMAADGRRATKLITHHLRDNKAGVDAVVEETIAVGRELHLLHGVLTCYEELTALCSPEAQQEYWRQLEAIATAKTYPDGDWQRAARITIAHRNENEDWFAHLVVEADRQAGGWPLIAAITDMHYLLMPELRTPAVLDELAAWTARCAREEAE